MKTQATLTVHGPRQLLRAFRKRLIDSLRSDAPDVQFTEIHSKESLLLELAAPQGVPFPELIAISTQYPECVATVAWRQDVAQGETTIQNGQVKEAVRGAAQSAHLPQYLRLAPDRSLVRAPEVGGRLRGFGDAPERLDRDQRLGGQVLRDERLFRRRLRPDLFPVAYGEPHALALLAFSARSE